jgi:tetratricopeptide (TPR) repeat protein
MRRTVDDIVETLKNAKAHGRKCTLLIGAGCSVKAGIPTAAGFVEAIEKDYSSAYRRAKEKTYAQCMAELTVGQQRDLITSYVDKARINWAHIGIAQLMKYGFVDRVLTTNFDLLVARACALLGLFPAVYDFAASQVFHPADVPEQAVFYLHGQYTGFILINTEKQFKKHSELLAPVFKDAGRGRVWLVAGYSGENDPVFDHLAQVPRFDQGLYWLGYLDSEPAKHVREHLLVNGKYAFYVNGFDADGFFITLAQRLNCFPPDLVCKPFSHLGEVLKLLTPYPIPAQDADIDWTENAHKLVRTAIEQFEEVPKAAKRELLPKEIPATVLMAQSYLMAGDYDKVVALGSEYDKGVSPGMADSLAWAYVIQGNALSDQAKTRAGEEADRLFAQAYEKYQAALEIKPDMHEALNNWGAALSDQAKAKAGEEADGLFALAYEKYQAALEIKPDKHEVLNNWGATLFAQAKTEAGEEADRQFAEAKEKLLSAEAISPGSAAYNLACLSALRGEEAECLRWLEKSRELGKLPSREHLANDPDLDNVRESEWFKAFLVGV